MSNTILVIGESGMGKSTSLRNLDPAETFIINVLDKPLPFRGSRANYTKAGKRIVPGEDGEESKIEYYGNYYASDSYNTIRSLINNVDTCRPWIKNLVIDDFQFTMCNEFMRKALEKGYDKYSEIAQHGWSLINDLIGCREDLNCFVLSHSQTDDHGKSKMKSIGNMVDKYIVFESMFSIVLHALKIDNSYKFLTQNDGLHMAKSPIDLFSDEYVDNDLQYVRDEIIKFAGGE